MNLSFGICLECEKEGNSATVLIVNKRHFLCQKHNRIRLDLQNTRVKAPNTPISKHRYSETFKYDTQWGFTKELEMFTHIWLNSPHVSQVSGKPLQFHPSIFAHILAKGLNKYPHYRLSPENIMLMTPEEHHLVDNGSKEQRERYEKENPPANFEKFYRRVEVLKKEYQQQYGYA